MKKNISELVLSRDYILVLVQYLLVTVGISNVHLVNHDHQLIDHMMSINI